MDVLGYLDKSIATFASDPPANDFQRGCLDTLKIARAELASALADDKPVPRVTTPDPQAAELVERLRRKYVRIPGTGERLVNPDGRAAADLIERLTRTPEPSLREALERAVETLAASRHLIGKYTPDHHWLPEHDQRIADLKAALSASPAEPEVSEAQTIQIIAQVVWKEVGPAITAARAADIARVILTALRSAVQRGDGG